MAPRVPPKKQVLLGFLERGVAMVHLDARRPGVAVPPQYTGDAHLRLNLSYRYNIPDFEITDEHVQATLSFSGRSFRCVLPWPSIFAITSAASADGQVWPEDLPVEVAQSSRGQKARPSQPPVTLAPVEEDTPSEAAQEPSKPSGAPARSHLRLVR